MPEGIRSVAQEVLAVRDGDDAVRDSVRTELDRELAPQMKKLHGLPVLLSKTRIRVVETPPLGSPVLVVIADDRRDASVALHLADLRLVEDALTVDIRLAKGLDVVEVHVLADLRSEEH